MDYKHPNAKILCLGNNTQSTDILTQKLAAESGSLCHGLLSELESPLDTDDYQSDGFYHSSVYDIAFGRLIDIANTFDRVIMLDQPMSEWSHPDAFYNTIKVLQSVSVPIKFIETRFPRYVDYFKNLTETNPSFCAFPFIGLLVDRGNTVICCRSNTPITPIQQLKNYANDPNYQTIRQKMLLGQRIPEYCGSCYALEDIGLISARQHETVEWANRLDLKSVDDFLSIEKPAYYEVRASNKCNLQCRMCGPGHSHLIDREYRQLGLIDRFKPPAEKFGGGFEIVEFDNLKKLYIAGGEPLVMHETYRFLDRCIQQGKTDFEFLINTNGTRINTKFKRLLKHFSNVHFIFSIDGFGDLNHYIRWPSNWNNIIENWRYLIGNNHQVSINTAVSIYNIHRLHELYQFVDQWFPGTVVHCQIVQAPTYLSPWLFPDSAQAVASLRLVQQTRCYKDNPTMAKNVDSWIFLFESQNHRSDSTLSEFFKFNDLLDQSRAVQLSEYDSSLDRWRQFC